MINDEVIAPLKEALKGQRHEIPEGMTKEQIAEFILQKAKAKD